MMIARFSARMAWRLGLRMSSPVLVAIALLGVAMALLVPELRGRAVTLVVPLTAGLQAALLFAPDDDPALEVLLAAPRPPWWIVLERLLPLLALQGAVGLLGTLLTAALWQAPVLALLADWLFPAAALIGLGLLLTFLTRRLGTGALLVLLIGGSFVLGGDALAVRFPALTLLHPYLIPPLAGAFAAPLGLDGDSAYLLNRAALLLIGVLCLARVLFGLRDAEAVLAADRRRTE